jgi:hypothetical protein
MVAETQTKIRREVDITIEWKNGRQRHMVSIECTDTRRRADIKWIDEMTGKHRRMPTTELILASRRGFSQRALIAASASGARTVDLRERRGSPAFPLGATGEVWEAKLSASPQVVTAVLPPYGENHGPEFVRLLPDNGLYFADGQLAGAAITYVHGAVGSEHTLGNPNVGVEHTKFRLEVRPVEWSPGHPLFLQRLSPPSLRPVDALVVSGTLVVPPRVKVALKHAQFDGVDVIWGASTLMADLIVATTDAAGKKRVSFGMEFAKARRRSRARLARR